MNKKLRGLVIFMFFMVYWVTLTERLTYEGFFVGILVVGIVHILNFELISMILDKRYISFKKAYYGMIYVLLLLKEIIIANIQVAIIVLNPKIIISPQTVTYRTNLKDPLLIAIFANSITLTPGTLTIEIKEDKILIHCLTEKYKNGITNSALENILLKIEE